MCNFSCIVYGWFSKLGSLLGVLFARVPYYIGDLKRDPNLENYPYKFLSMDTETPNSNTPAERSTWKASSLYLGATLSQLWATVGYGSLLFWATWLFR